MNQGIKEKQLSEKFARSSGANTSCCFKQAEQRLIDSLSQVRSLSEETIALIAGTVDCLSTVRRGESHRVLGRLLSHEREPTESVRGLSAVLGAEMLSGTEHVAAYKGE